MVSLDLSQKDSARAISRVETRLARTPKDPAALLLAASQPTQPAAISKKSEQAAAKDDRTGRFELSGLRDAGPSNLAQQRLDEALAEFDELSKRRAASRAGDTPSPASSSRRKGSRKRRADAATRRAGHRSWNARGGSKQSGLDVRRKPARIWTWLCELAQSATGRLPTIRQFRTRSDRSHYKEKGLATLAVPLLQKSVRLDPQNPILHFHLGLADLKAGDSPKARVALQRASALAPDFAGAAAAKQCLLR